MRPIRLLQLATFVSTLDRFAMPPVLIAIARDLDAPLSEVMHAAGAYFLAYGLMQPVWGLVSQRIGLVRTMRLTLLLAALSTGAAALVWTPLALGVARGLAGGFFAAAYPASLIYLGDTVPARRRQREIAQLMIGVALGIALASAGAGLVAQASRWRAAFVATGVVGVVTAVLLGKLAEPPAHPDRAGLVRSFGHVLRTRAAVFVLVLAFVEGAVLLGVLTLLPPAVEAAGSPAALAGAVTAIYGVGVFTMAGVVGRLSTRLHPAWLIGVGATAALLACAVLAVTRIPTVVVGVAVLLAIAWTAMHSSLQTWATEVVSGARPAMMSLFACALFGGSAIAAVVFADLAEAGSYGTIFLVAGVVSVPLGLLATAGRARWREDTA